MHVRHLQSAACSTSRQTVSGLLYSDNKPRDGERVPFEANAMFYALTPRINLIRCTTTVCIAIRNVERKISRVIQYCSLAVHHCPL